MQIAPPFFACSLQVFHLRFSFSPQKRLLTAAEYSQVFNQGCCKAGDNAFLLLARQNQLEIGRLGLAVSKKQLRRAVDRNRVKRMARETFRQHENLSGFDLVLLCRPGVKGLDKSEIRHKLDTLFDKIARSKK